MIGDNLNQLSESLKVIKASDADELRLKLAAFQMPISIVSIYSQAAYHYAWIIVNGVSQEKIDQLNEMKPKRAKK